MQDEPDNLRQVPTPPSAGPMPTPITSSPADKPIEAKPLNQAVLAEMLKKADSIGIVPPSQHPPSDASTPRPGNVIKPTVPPAGIASQPTQPAAPSAPPAIPLKSFVRPLQRPVPTGPPPIQTDVVVPPLPKPPEPVPVQPPPKTQKPIDVSKLDATPMPLPQPVILPPAPEPEPLPPPLPPTPPVPEPVPSAPEPEPIPPSPKPPEPAPEPFMQPEPELAPPPAKPPRQPINLSGWLSGRGVLLWPLLGLALLLLLVTMPSVRYNAAALVLKKDFTLTVTDSTTGDPVSDAVLSVGSVTAMTDGEGRATLVGVKPGNRAISISKPYYQAEQVQTLIPILSQKTSPTLQISTSGSLVKISLANLITKQSLAGADIAAGSVNAITDASGEALVALPNTGVPQLAKLSMAGYNSKSVNLVTATGIIKQTTTMLTPVGKLYYLAKPVARVNVMRANLDGTSAKTLVAGSGFENNQTTLIASPDNKYLALLARHTTDPHPQIYVVDASKGSFVEAAFGDNLKLLGWIGSSVFWQDGNALKSFDAPLQKANSLNALASASQLEQLSSSHKLSPAGTREAWSSSGKVVVAAKGGGGAQVVATGFSLVGWYNDQYILLTKSSVLYISSADAPSAPVRVANIF